MDTKARVLVIVGGVVLVGMVAWVLMPGGTTAPPVDVTTDTAQQTDAFVAAPPTIPATQPVATVDPFALPATYPTNLINVGPSLPPADSTDVWGRALDGDSPSNGSSISSLPPRGNDAFTSSVVGSRFEDAGTSARPTELGSTPKTYVIVAGDSLYTIAERVLGSSKHVNKILAANPGIDPKKLKVGQTIKMPDLSSSTTISAPVSMVSPQSTVKTATASAAKTYKVQSGDTLRRISAKVYGDEKKWDKLYAANRTLIGSDPSKLRAGSVLQVPAN